VFRILCLDSFLKSGDEVVATFADLFPEGFDVEGDVGEDGFYHMAHLWECKWWVRCGSCFGTNAHISESKYGAPGLCMSAR
jgi:hypothetical protein